MKRFVILTFQYYRLLVLYNIACTLLIIFICFVAGFLTAGNLFYAKLIGFACAAGLQYYSSKETYFYFRNAGYRVRQVIASALAIDVLLVIVVITIYLKVK